MKAYVGIGSNLGDRHANVDKALGLLGRVKEIKVLKVSSLRETEPVGGPRQGKFLNGAVEIDTTLDPRGLLLKLNEIEKLLGRKRMVKNGPRTIDLDILFYGNFIVTEKDLTIPHPRIKERNFVVEPLRELGVSI